jgi:hypothetical protein
VISKLSEGDNHTSDVEKGLVGFERAIPTHNELAKVPQPGKSAFYFPTPLVTSEFTSILQFRLTAIETVGANKINPTSPQSQA